jgi:large subunit ribosomal protein L22e
MATVSQPRNHKADTISYLKYLTKRYVKKQSMSDFLRVVATTKDTYTLRYFKVDQDEAEDEE